MMELRGKEEKQTNRPIDRDREQGRGKELNKERREIRKTTTGKHID